MDKIYSRKRIRVPKLNNTEQKKIKKITKLMAIIIIATIVFVVITKSITPIFDHLCSDKAKSLATIVSNQEATKVMENYKYEDLVTIYKDKNENINMIQANVIPINEIISDVAIKIEESLNNTQAEDIGIRLGSFTGSKILSGRGPLVPIKISTIGNVKTDFRSEFTEAGINQTLHRIYLEVECEVCILTPFHNIEEKITNQVILAENVIVGIVPSTYYNLDGLESKNQALEVME